MTTFWRFIAACGLVVGFGCVAAAQTETPSAEPPRATTPAVPPEKDSPAAPAANAERALADEQQRLADDYARLEQKLRRLAQVSAAADPARAALLKQAFAESKQRFLAGQLEAIARSLAEPVDGGGPAFDRVLDGQSKVQADLKALVDLLQNESQAKAAESEARRLKELAQRLGRLIRSQEGIAGRTESGDEEKRLAADQGELADRTGDLHGDVEKQAAEQRAAAGEQHDSNNAAENGQKKTGDPMPLGENGDAEKPGGKQGKPSGEPGQPGDAAPMDGAPTDEAPPKNNDENEDSLAKRLERANRAMREAQKKLEQANRKEAAAEQRTALEQLKAAQAEIERILRQMREEQVSRTLVALEQRFRAMLDAEIAVYDETKQLDKTPVDQRSAEDDIKAGRIGRKQQEIVLMCDRALTLLHDDGSAAALAEAVEQLSGDMRMVAELLGQSRVDAYTQQIEQDIVAALDEILAAVKQAQADAKQPRPPRDPGETGPAGEPPLVDMLAELKMLRTMQVRVNRRLKQIGELTQSDETNDPQLRKGLNELAGRQQRLVEITRDIVTGKTE
ncbi:MAG: hypothetical protein WD875_13240 [Pirellulales bacterium]